MHSTEYRHIRTLLESEKLTATQLTLDHEAGGPPFEVLMDQASQILAKKLLLVGLSGSLTFILFATALNLLIVPGFNVSHLKPFLKVIPEDRRRNITPLLAPP